MAVFRGGASRSSLPIVLPLALALLGCDGARAPWSEPPQAALDLRIAVPVTAVPVFGEFEVTLDLFRRQDVEVEFAPEPPGPVFTGTVRSEPERVLGGGRWRRFVLLLRPVCAPGPVQLPPFLARAADGATATTPAIELTVTTLLADAGSELEAPGGLLPPWRSPWPLFGVLLLLLSVAAVLFLLLRRRRRAPPAATVAVPPHARALRELARLRALPRRTAAEVSAFYVAVSQVLRVYLEERFGLRAPERTTEEFLLELEAGGPLSVAQVLELRRFLQQCDLVKFAAMLPGEEVHAATLAIAEQLVHGTRGDAALEAVA